jgi:hypothetical protein
MSEQEQSLALMIRELKNLKDILIQAIIRLDERIPVNQIQKLTDLVSTPIKIDDRGIIATFKEFQKNLEQAAGIDIVKVLGEFKFFSQRLVQMDEKIDRLAEQGISQDVRLSFQVDGYKLVKKTHHHDETSPIVEPYLEYKSFFKDLEEDDKRLVMTRLGICGYPKMTFKAYAEKYGRSAVYVSHKFHRAIAIMSRGSHLKTRLKELAHGCPLRELLDKRTLHY